MRRKSSQRNRTNGECKRATFQGGISSVTDIRSVFSSTRFPALRFLVRYIRPFMVSSDFRYFSSSYTKTVRWHTIERLS